MLPDSTKTTVMTLGKDSNYISK